MIDHEQDHGDHGALAHETPIASVEWATKFLSAALCQEGSPSAIAAQVFQAAPDAPVGDVEGVGRLR
jgi:hypothetical protein